MAVCEECGSVYAARQWPDDTIRIIGQEGCSCGATSFEIVSDASGDATPDTDFDSTDGNRPDTDAARDAVTDTDSHDESPSDTGAE